MNKVAVVILNWNGRMMLEQFLPTIMKHTKANVYVADNASTDDSLAVVQRFPQVRLIRLDRNYGFAEGYNKAIEHVCEPYCVLLNSDVEVKDDWVTPLLQFMETHHEVAACQPKILSQLQPEQFEYAGAAGGFLDALGYPYCRGRVFATVENDLGQYDTDYSVFWATGAALMIRTEIYREVGGLDTRFFAHMEEIDLCWRLRSRGKGVYCVPSSRVYHVGGGTLPKENPQKTYLNFRNNLYMLYKNLPEDRLQTVMRWRWWLDRIAAIQFLLKGEKASFLAVFRAHRDFEKNKSQFDADRRNNLERTVLSSIPEMQLPSLLWRYYFCRQITYAEIAEY